MRRAAYIGLLLSAFAMMAWSDPPPQPPAFTDEQRDAILKAANAPPGSTVDLEVVNTTTDGGKTRTTKRGSTVGASGYVEGDKLKLMIDGKASELSLTELGLVRNEGFSSDSSAEIKNSNAGRIVLGLIGLLIAGLGALALYLKQPMKASAGMIGVGACLILAAIWPAFEHFIMVGMALYVVGCLWLTGSAAAKSRETNRASGVALSDLANPASQSYSPEAFNRFVTLFKSHADPADVAELKKVAKADDLIVPLDSPLPVPVVPVPLPSPTLNLPN